MARQPRIHLPGALYHVMLRGNGGQTIFFNGEHRDYFESLVGEGVTRFEHRIHGYCWMENHVHLAIQVNQIQLAATGQWEFLNSRSQPSVNRNHCCLTLIFYSECENNTNLACEMSLPFPIVPLYLSAVSVESLMFVKLDDWHYTCALSFIHTSVCSENLWRSPLKFARTLP